MKNLKEKIREEMVVKQEDVESRLFEKAREFIKLSDNGEPHFSFNLSDVYQKSAITWYLIGVWFSFRGDFRDSDIVPVREISAETGIPFKQTSARLGELVKDKVVSSEKRGEYRINYVNLESMLDKLINEVKTE